MRHQAIIVTAPKLDSSSYVREFSLIIMIWQPDHSIKDESDYFLVAHPLELAVYTIAVHDPKHSRNKICKWYNAIWISEYINGWHNCTHLQSNIILKNLIAFYVT